MRKNLFAAHPIESTARPVLWLFTIAFSIACYSFAAAQSLPISIDSRFDDWSEATASYMDNASDGGSLELLNFQVANDETYLFLRIELDDELELTDNNNLSLYMDIDNNPSTGTAINGIGAELQIRLGDRLAWIKNGNATLEFSLYDLGFFAQPSVSAKTFEMAIGRFATPNGNQILFPNSLIKILFQNGSSGDRMPNSGETFTYQFDDSPTPPFQPLFLEKSEDKHLRLLTWNTLFDGLIDDERKGSFENVIAAIQPDIVTFNECWDMTAGQAATFMNVASPLPNFQSWKAVKLDEGNITASRYPILQNWLIYPGHRLTASLIDLPNVLFQTDLLVINAHLRCCDADNLRQEEADAFVKFILDAKTPGGIIDLPENTPFVLSGDLNLVGFGQQLRTLLTGQIVNTSQFGPGGAPDWDGSGLEDIVATHTEDRMAYTWYNEFSSFPPSRIDYHICSNSVMEVARAYTLKTSKMSNERLDFYNLEKFDTDIASDHLPKVTDFVLPLLSSTAEPSKTKPQVAIYPNPSKGSFYVKLEHENPAEVIFSLENAAGKTWKTWKDQSVGQALFFVETTGWPAGMYFLKIQTANSELWEKVLIME
jgi:endonuclease/exonuclease/phosphatase family metal-dependent hydrolase